MGTTDRKNEIPDRPEGGFLRPDLRPCHIVSQRLRPIDEALIVFASRRNLIVRKNISRIPGRALTQHFSDGESTLNITTEEDPRRVENLSALRFKIVLLSWRMLTGVGYWRRDYVWRADLSYEQIIREIDYYLATGWQVLLDWNTPDGPPEGGHDALDSAWKWDPRIAQ